MASIQFIPPPLLAAASFESQLFYFVGALLGMAILVPVLTTAWIFWIDARHAKKDLRLPDPEEPESTDVDPADKRPGQFSVFDLLVLTTVAAVACAIVRLPLNPLLKILALIAVWFGFSRWALGRPDARQARSLAYKRRVAVLSAVSTMLIYSPYLWLHFFQRPTRHFYFDLGFVLFFMLLGPIPAIWKAVRAVRAELAAAQRKKTAVS